MEYKDFIEHIKQPSKWENPNEWERVTSLEKYYSNNKAYKVLRIGFDKESEEIDISVVYQKRISEDDWDDVCREILYENIKINEVESEIPSFVFKYILWKMQ